jgi:Flp pilus assembly protein TadD
VLSVKPFPRHSLRAIVLAGVAALALSACASNRSQVASPDFTGMSADQARTSVAQLQQQYEANPRDKRVVIYYAAALRAAGQPGQAVAVLQQATLQHRGDTDIAVAYAKALVAAGNFKQALEVIDRAIRPEAPDWNALSVKGAVLDQMGRNEEARALYQQALVTAPNQASLYANLGLSYAMTGDLVAAERNLRKAASMRGASTQVRQNLALVVGLSGNFEEARSLYARELPPDQVEANMAYIRALLTQQNRWDLIKGEG